MITDVTGNGVPYTWDLAGSSGASFLLFPLPTHTHQDVVAAKQWLRDNQDIVSIRVADEADRDYDYKDSIFRHPAVRDLKWYQINTDEKLLRACRTEGMSIDDYVTTHVLPKRLQTEVAIRKKYNCPTGDPLYR